MVTNRFKWMVCGLLVAFAPMTALAQEKAAKRDGDKDKPGLIGRVLYLLPANCAAELNLAAEQKTQIQKLEQEFQAKRILSLSGTVSRVMTIVEHMDAADDAKEVAPILALCHEVTGGLLEARRTRMSYEKKVVDVLNAEQQAKFAHLKERRIRDRGDHAAHAADAKTTLHFYYSPQGQEKLQLTATQKQQLQEIQKEMESRLRTLLTDEQRKIFDDRASAGDKTSTSKSPRPKQKDK